MSAQVQISAVTDPRHLPTPPGAAMELLALARDPDAGITDMIRVLSLDAGLAARIIATANSAIYRRDREATTLERAVSQIGVRSIVTLALAHSVAGQLPVDGQISGIELGAYWQHSLTCAVACRELVPERSDEAFLIGLLADVGKIAMARSLGQSYEALAAATDGWPSPADEAAAYGLSSLDASAQAFEHWRLPAVFATAMRACAAGSAAGREDAQVFADALAIALPVASFVVGGGRPELLRAVHDAAEAVGADTGRVEALIANLASTLSEAADMLAVRVDEADYEALLDDARMQLVDLSMQADVERQREQERVAQLEREKAELEARVMTDALTGLANRAAFDQALEQQIRLRMRAPEMYTKPLGVVMIDIDHFKVVNDTHGHAIGDAVLHQLGLVLQMMSRSEETAARYGGEEFALVAPLATPDDLTVLCERVRRAVELIEVDSPSGPIHVTASLGGACLQRAAALDDSERVLAAADAQLYEAKRAGRNQTRVRPDVL